MKEEYKTRQKKTLLIAIAIVCMVGGALWILGLNMRGIENYMYLILATIISITGIFILAFAMREDDAWIIE